MVQNCARVGDDQRVIMLAAFVASMVKESSFVYGDLFTTPSEMDPKTENTSFERYKVIKKMNQDFTDNVEYCNDRLLS